MSVLASPSTMIEYPKIETVFDRDEKTFRVIEGKLRLPEFGLINRWKVTEKIDGTNVRVGYGNAYGPDWYVEFGGRTDNAQMPTFLLKYLQEKFTVAKMAAAFPDVNGGTETPTESPQVILFGEGYGVKIQSGGNYRTEGVAFRLFDVKVGQWWLKEEAVADIASKLEIAMVPTIGVMTLGEAVELVRGGKLGSSVSLAEAEKEHLAEGIVAKTEPPLFDRRGDRLIWKLKVRDFAHGKKRG